MSNPFLPEPQVEPVRVVEQIPVAGKSNLTPEQMAKEKIPSPDHLLVNKAFAMGGMGHVHPAIDRNLLRPVALKRLDPRYAANAFYRDGFVAEGQMTGQLEHPNIVPVHELAVDNGVPYFTMKLVQGVSFEKWLGHPERRPGSVERIEAGIEILLKVCDALAYAHYRGVIHRDLKPANIMVGDFGQVYLMDWGLAKLSRTQPQSGDRAMMNAKGPVGTPHYMAPEQARGNPPEMDERSDIFGLGALLFELLSGQSPYGNHEPDKVLDRAAAGQVISIDKACEHIGISKRIRMVAEKATSPDPTKRFQTVKEMQDAMRAFLHGGLHLPRKFFKAGEIIFREGDKGDCAYMIVAGRCRAFRIVDGQEETLAMMEQGEAFGEMALILFEPRAASVVAAEDATVLVLDQQTMNEGLGLSGWTGALVRAMAQRFADLEQVVRTSGLRRS